MHCLHALVWGDLQPEQIQPCGRGGLFLSPVQIPAGVQVGTSCLWFQRFQCRQRDVGTWSQGPSATACPPHVDRRARHPSASQQHLRQRVLPPKSHRSENHLICEPPGRQVRPGWLPTPDAQTLLPALCPGTPGLSLHHLHSAPEILARGPGDSGTPALTAAASHRGCAPAPLSAGPASCFRPKSKPAVLQSLPYHTPVHPVGGGAVTTGSGLNGTPRPRA